MFNFGDLDEKCKIVRHEKNASQYHNIIIGELSTLLYSDIDTITSKAKDIVKRVYAERKKLGAIKGGSPVMIDVKEENGKINFYSDVYTRGQSSELKGQKLIFSIERILK